MASRLRVLIADDNARVVKSLSRMLALDYDIVGSVANGAGLLEVVEQLQPDVVVLDLTLKDGDSLEACRKITERNPEMRVIVFTAMSDPDISQRSFAVGASAFVSKLAAIDLLSTVKRLCPDRS